MFVLVLYLLLRRSKPISDHACLRWLNNSKNTSDLVTRWQERLSQFASKNHGNADSLSRRPCEDCGSGPHPPELECENQVNCVFTGKGGKGKRRGR